MWESSFKWSNVVLHHLYASLSKRILWSESVVRLLDLSDEWVTDDYFMYDKYDPTISWDFSVDIDSLWKSWLKKSLSLHWRRRYELFDWTQNPSSDQDTRMSRDENSASGVKKTKSDKSMMHLSKMILTSRIKMIFTCTYQCENSYIIITPLNSSTYSWTTEKCHRRCWHSNQGIVIHISRNQYHRVFSNSNRIPEVSDLSIFEKDQMNLTLWWSVKRTVWFAFNKIVNWSDSKSSLLNSYHVNHSSIFDHVSLKMTDNNFHHDIVDHCKTGSDPWE